MRMRTGQGMGRRLIIHIYNVRYKKQLKKRGNKLELHWMQINF